MDNGLIRPRNYLFHDLPAWSSSFEAVTARAVVLNEDHRDLVVARPFDQARDSAHYGFESCTCLSAPLQTGNVKNRVLKIDHDDGILGHKRPFCHDLVFSEQKVTIVRSCL